MTKGFSIIFLIFLDQISKFGIRNYLENPIEITSFFRIIFTENEGIAFSLPASNWFIIPFTFLVLVFLGWLLRMKNIPKWECVAGVLIFGGAVGNLIDRVVYGKVTDFLSFWEFPVFNLADCFISVGVGVYILSEVLKKQKNKKTKN